MMMNRRMFLLFLSAMSVSIIVMVIIYGLFIKDLDFSFEVKNPESAPSPIDAYDQPVAEEEGAPAKISTPEQAQAEQQQAEEAAAQENENPDAESAITEVVPLQPQIGREENPAEPPLPNDEDAGLAVTVSSAPSLHYVYLDGFSSRDAAEQAIAQFQGRNLVAQPYIRQHRGQIILQFGVFSDRENADAMARQLRGQNVFVKVD